MNLTQIMQQRYSTKAFDPQKAITKEDFAQLKTVLRLSPSSTNLQPWHFIIADNLAARERVAKGCVNTFASNKKKIVNASHVIVFCALSKADDAYLAHIADKEEQDGRYRNAEVKAHMRHARENFLQVHRANESQWHARQVYLSMGALLLAAATLGIDAVPIEGIDTDILNDEFALTAKGYHALAVVALGYRSPEDFNVKLPKSRLDESVIFSHV